MCVHPLATEGVTTHGHAGAVTKGTAGVESRGTPPSHPPAHEAGIRSGQGMVPVEPSCGHAGKGRVAHLEHVCLLRRVNAMREHACVKKKVSAYLCTGKRR